MKEVCLTDVCRIQYGYPFDSSLFSASDGMPLVRIRDVVRGYSETYTKEPCGDEYIVNDGDLLVGMDGEFNIARWKGGKALLNQRVCRLTAKDGMDESYLFYFMQKELKKIEDKTPFATVKHLSARQLNSVMVPVRPIEEQKKIAAVLEKIDGLTALRQRQIDKLEKLVKSKFVEMFGDERNPKNGAEFLPLGRLATFINGYAFKPDDWGSAGLPIVRIQNLTGNNETINYYNGSYPDQIEINDGDVLISWSASLGVYLWNRGKALLNQHIFKVSFDKMEIDKYFFLFAVEQKMDEMVLKTHGATMKHIVKGEFENTKIAYPPLLFQRQFARFARQSDESGTAIRQSIEKLETLKRSLMQQYF